MNGLWAILLKEFAHIRRERNTLFFAFAVPVLQLTIFGYAIDTKIERIRTVVFDLDGRDESRRLIEAFVNSRTFRVVARVHSDEDYRRAIVSGRAQVAIKVPPDFTSRLLTGQRGAVQVLIDGSDSQVALTALNTTNLLGLNRSMARGRVFFEARQIAVARDPYGALALPIEVRPRLLFNPELRSARFFVPALVGIILQLVTLFLTSFAIVREREQGTLEQLFVTPVGRLGLLLGKLIPYACIGFVETLVVLTVMVCVFGVPIEGSLALLLLLALLFLFTALGLGLLVSTVARTQLQAVQVAFLIMLPSILLSGFMFPRDSMPWPIYALTFLIPVTHFLEILRGIILRSAGLSDLWPHVAALAACCAVILVLSVARFRKQLD
jgi:ribosome-dependent ATPase